MESGEYIAVFIDESGDLNLEVPGFYVACAVTAASGSVQGLWQSVKEISASRCGGSELKSSRTGSNIKSRTAILSDISNLPIRAYAIAVNKDAIDKTSGLQWRKSMYKFTQRILFDRIHKTRSSIDVTFDTFGRSDFMSSFENYIDKHFERTLFSSYTIQHRSPRECPPIQISDYLAGSIWRMLEGKDGSSILSSASQVIMGLQVWPSANEPIDGLDKDSELDNRIRTHCINSAKSFMAETDDELLRSVCEMMIHEKIIGDDDFMLSDEMLRRLKANGLVDTDKSKTWFMNQVIAPLRDSGVLIAACQDGYKIPSSREDVQRFVKFVEMKTAPYLKRMGIMRESLTAGTGMKYDLIDESELLSRMLTPNIERMANKAIKRTP